MKFKKFLAGAAAAAIVGSASVIVFAEYYHDYDFDIQTYDHGGVGYSGAAYKDDNYDYASIYCQDGYLSSTSFTYLAACNSSKSVISTEAYATACDNTWYTVDYTTLLGSSSEKLYLRSRSGYYGVHIKGYWRP